MTREDVAQALAAWIADHQANGGDYCGKASIAAGDAARVAELSGLDFHQCFEAGRTAYFNNLDPTRRVTNRSMVS